MRRFCPDKPKGLTKDEIQKRRRFLGRSAERQRAQEYLFSSRSSSSGQTKSSSASYVFPAPPSTIEQLSDATRSARIEVSEASNTSNGDDCSSHDSFRLNRKRKLDCGPLVSASSSEYESDNNGNGEDDNGEDGVFMDEGGYSPANEDDAKNMSNVYSAVLMGLSWWKLLKRLYPKIPKRLNPELRKQLQSIDPGWLEARYGKNPTRAVFPELEKELDIDLYVLYGGGVYSPLGISYRPLRVQKKEDIAGIISRLENVDDTERPCVVLQAGKNYFNRLGTFHVMPTRKNFEDRDKNWISLWEAVTKKAFPGIKRSQLKAKEKLVKLRVLGTNYENRHFTIADDIFKKIRQCFKVNIKIFIGSIANDNANLKKCVYSSLDTPDNVNLNLLVASYKEDEFDKEFTKITGMSYKLVESCPGLLPLFSANMSYQRRAAICKKYVDPVEISKIMRWSADPNHSYHGELDETAKVNGDDGANVSADLQENPATLLESGSKESLNDDDDDDGEEEDDALSYVDFDRLTENASSADANNRNKCVFIEDECGESGHESEGVYGANISENESAVGEDDEDNDDEETALAGIETEEYSEYKPIRNILSIAPNVFDESTRVRVLPDNSVRKLYFCKTRGCLFAHSNRRALVKHEATCSAEPVEVVKQTVENHRINEHRQELFEENYLPSVEYAQEYFTTYDIECTMDGGPFEPGPKFHNLATIASYSSNGERQCFIRQGPPDDPISACVLCTEFINYLLILQERLAESVPQCIKDGILHYSDKLEEEEKKKAKNPQKSSEYRKKLKYLKDFLKLKIYAWVGERYDLVVIFATLVEAFCGFGHATKEINHIKRDAGIMLLESRNLSFRDFKNYTCPMSLEDLARASGLDPSKYAKGFFPYEWYTSIDQMRNANQLAAYTCFNSTMVISKPEFVGEMNSIIKEKIEAGEWRNERMPLLERIHDFLGFDALEEDPALFEYFNSGKSPVIADRPDIASPHAFYQDMFLRLVNLIKFDSKETMMWCFDEEDEATARFFRASVKKYAASRELWSDMAALSREQGDNAEKPSMLLFLINYNYSDVILLEGAITNFARNNLEKFRLGIHGEISISQIAHKIAFEMYDKSCPPICSVPPDFAYFMRDLRKNLTGGICQVLHRAITLNGPSPYLPPAAYQTSEGLIYKKCVLVDFNSLYPGEVRKDMPCGGGIMYRLDEMNYTNPLCASKERRFFGEGMLKQRENTTLDSIRWLEYLNRDTDPEGFRGIIRHAYNAEEVKIGNLHVDGYAEIDNINNISPQMQIVDKDGQPLAKKRFIFEYCGCSFHACPHCRRKPFRAMKKWVQNESTGRKEEKFFTLEQIVEADELRIRTLVATLRELDNLDDGLPNIWYVNDKGETVRADGCAYFPHRIEVVYNCQWIKRWRNLEMAGHSPDSKIYPGLFKGAKNNTGVEPGSEGITEEEFKKMVETEDAEGKSRFFGFAVVDLESPPSVIASHPDVPPIFAKHEITLDDLRGDLTRTLSDAQKKRLFPVRENIFSYHVKDFMVTSEVLQYYVKKGLKYRTKYFVQYYRGAPFKPFVNTMVADRVEALRKKDTALQNWIKVIMNAKVGYFAIDRSKFLQTKIITSGQLYTTLRNPRLKSLTPLIAEGRRTEPLYEAVFKKKRVVHETALQIQIAVYQNSKLLFFQFIDVLREFLKKGTWKLCYADTDSFMLALTENSLEECVQLERLEEWRTVIVPKWFAWDDNDLASQKEPGLLKTEASLSKGWFIALSPKCYIMAECDRTPLEDELADPNNRSKVYEILNKQREMSYNTKNISKRSAKGCNKKVVLSHYDYLAALFSDDMSMQIRKDMPLFQYDKKEGQIKTFTMNKRVISSTLKKRIIGDDKVSTFPLRHADDSLF